MKKIRDNIYIGGMSDVTTDTLVAYGITAVLNVAHGVNDPIMDKHHISQVKVGLVDSMENKPYMKELAVSSLKALLYNHETVLVHCRAGISRSVYVVVRALAEMEGKENHTVFDEILAKKPNSLYGPLFANL